jgi:AcrR family transcriptional regulator
MGKSMSMNQNIRGEILSRAQQMFFSHGYRKVTIDSIAASLSISKKTIYKYFGSKKELLEKAFELYRENITRDINSVLETPGLQFPEKLKRVLSRIGVNLGGMNSLLLKDIQDLTPDLWERIRTYKHEAAYLRFNRLIEEGRLKGHIKKDINRAVIVALYASAIENLLDPAFIRNLPDELRHEIPVLPVEVFENAMRVIYEGILTPETIRSLG